VKVHYLFIIHCIIGFQTHEHEQLIRRFGLFSIAIEVLSGEIVASNGFAAYKP
jgi:hypothetical protein